MDKITLDVSPPTERENSSPISPKRPRTDCAVPINHRGESKFPNLVTFWKTIGTPSSTNALQKNADLVCTEECGEDEKPPEQQDSELIVTPITKLNTSHSDNARTESSEFCFLACETHFLLLEKDEQPHVSESDKLNSNSGDDTDGASAESRNSKDAGADTSSHPDCRRLGESLEDEPPGGCNLPAGDVGDGRQVQNSVSQIQAFTHNSSDEEVRCRFDCTHEDMRHDTGFCNTWSLTAEVEESNQKSDGQGFSEIILFSREKEEGNSPLSSADYADTKSFYSNPKEDPCENLAGGVKNEEEILELQICENENVAVCDGETKGQVNENGLSKNSTPPTAECAEGSIVSYDVVLARNIATENVSLETDDDFCGAKGEHAAGKMIAEAWSKTADHTTETPMPARISQEPAEGDNDAGPFSVIDPAIGSETDREAEEKRCNSESTAGAELSPSVKVCEMEMPLPLCSDVRPSQEVSVPDQTWQFNQQSRTQRSEDEKEDLCQSYTEPQACSITTNDTHNKTGNETSCLWKSGPSSSPKLPTAEDRRQESHETIGHQQLGCFSVSLDQMKTQEVEYVLTEVSRMDTATEIKEKEEISSLEDEQKSENSTNVEERLLQENEKHKEDTTETSTGEYNDQTAGKISKYATKITHIDEGNNLECLSDHQHVDVTVIMEGTTEEKERKEEAGVVGKSDVQGNSEVLVTSADDQRKGDMTEASPDECVSEWTEGNMSKSGNKLTLVTHHDLGNDLSSFSDYQNKAEKDERSSFSFPATSDAVVPSPHEVIHSQNVDSNPTALNCSDRFSTVPSAFTLCDRVPGGFDTFEKIQLSPDDDDDDDAGLSNSPLLTSLPGQLLHTPQRQLYHSMPEADSSEHEEVPEGEEGEGEEEVEKFECHTENVANGFLNSDYSCNELANFISAADVTALSWPEQCPHSESACESSECFQHDPQLTSSTVFSQSDRPASVMNDSPKFEMKKHFDMVLKELKLFFDISMSEFASDSRTSSPEQCSDVTEAMEDDASNCKVQLSSPQPEHHRDASSDDADEDLDMCGGDPVVSCTSGSVNGEQEVPLGSHVCQESSMHTAEKHREPQETEQKRKMWSPSFTCQPFLEQLSHRPPEQPRRLEPLRTCTRPIRVGLSKRAKTKHLHRHHPYK
ncbi:hypothetical protein E3U43_017371 [Larimichthys crocea]|uniref:Uncharacterized protein n=1 Tax=Larimichthys crocea TaxID=215358 RepID=A0ACD3R117_LARCR|nr:hypothetical protein E3U43_017371 [Larimichthys crocea]